MRLVHSLFLLGVGSLALFLCSVAARADSIPTLTATSVGYSKQIGFKDWSISGDSFSLSGGGGALGTPGFETVGQPFSPGGIDAFFGASYGPGGLTVGSVTLNGITHTVVLQDVPSFLFQPGFIYQHTVTGTDPDGSLAVVTTVPTVIGYNSSSSLSQLQELFCNSPAMGPECLGNVLANVSIDVPGVTALYGFQHPGDNFDSIASVSFTSTPEPVSAGLTSAGMIAALGFMASSRRSQSGCSCENKA